MKKFSFLFASFLLSGCTLLPIDRDNSAPTIADFKKAIECEITSIIHYGNYNKKFDLYKWDVKSQLDLTLVDTFRSDGTATVPLASPTLPIILPTASYLYNNTRIGHIEFVTEIDHAVKTADTKCRGLDPSETHLGLASWVIATLDTIEKKNYSAVSYTANLDITANAGSRFGFVFSRVDLVDASLAFSRQGTHRLTISMSPPQPPPAPTQILVSKAIPVYITKKGREEKPTAPGALRNPTLDRTLQRFTPLQIGPGSVVR